MSKTLIYLIAIFALWFFFYFSSPEGQAEEQKKTEQKKPGIGAFDEGRSGYGGAGRV